MTDIDKPDKRSQVGSMLLLDHGLLAGSLGQRDPAEDSARHGSARTDSARADSASDGQVHEAHVDEPEPIADPAVAWIGPLQDRRTAREWALVLQSQAIAYVLQPAPEGLYLRIAAGHQAHAQESIELYEEENRNWPPPRTTDAPRHEPSPAILIAFIGLILFFFNVTGPVRGGSSWFSNGRADAELLLSQPWRMVTALTLHADAQHVIGNAISGTIFGSMVNRRIGPGGALLGIVVAGTLGNAANALYHLPGGHRSIGASTAVFAAVGILAAVQTVIVLGKRATQRKWAVIDFLAPVVGGLALLGTLGSGGGQDLGGVIRKQVNNTDLGAHGFGFAAGAAVGLAVGIAMHFRNKDKPSPYVQVGAGVAAAAIVAGSWALALV